MIPAELVLSSSAPKLEDDPLPKNPDQAITADLVCQASQLCRSAGNEAFKKGRYQGGLLYDTASHHRTELSSIPSDAAQRQCTSTTSACWALASTLDC